MFGPFRGDLARWASQPDGDAWLVLLQQGLASPWRYLRTNAWAPMRPTTRRALAVAARAQSTDANALWAATGGLADRLLPNLRDGIAQDRLWQLLTVATQRELTLLAWWSGARLVRSQIAADIRHDRASRWRRRLSEGLYRDVLLDKMPWGLRAPAVALQDLRRGRRLLDLGWHVLLLSTQKEPHDACERLLHAAGPRFDASAGWGLQVGAQQVAEVTASLFSVVQRNGTDAVGEAP